MGLTYRANKAAVRHALKTRKGLKSGGLRVEQRLNKYNACLGLTGLVKRNELAVTVCWYYLIWTRKRALARACDNDSKYPLN
jgi:hypothetical protein